MMFVSSPSLFADLWISSGHLIQIAVGLFLLTVDGPKKTRGPVFTFLKWPPPFLTGIINTYLGDIKQAANVW